MSYLVLARKSRPQTFEEVVGQRPVVKTLINSLSRNRVAHAILFSGVRGVGKTTLARLMAKAINCENREGKIPCNTCNSCLEIMRGTAIDLHEIDGASNRGIQEIRELKERIRFLPTSAHHKIIIIDEVHMLTTEAFNALLKTLEEPPEHVYFMFATTELHKVPITILSRCQRYELKRISAQELTDHFAKLAQQEGREIAPQALSLIVREAEGSVRDGLSLLDQVFSFADSRITTEDVVQVLGLIGRDVLINITRALLAGDRTQALKALDEIFEFGIDLKRFCTDLLECFRTLVLCKIPGCTELLDMSDQDKKMFNKLAADFSLETIHQKLCLLMKAVEEMGHSLQPRLALETAFLKIIEAQNVVPATILLGHLQELLSGLGQEMEQIPKPAGTALSHSGGPQSETTPTTTGSGGSNPPSTPSTASATKPQPVTPPPGTEEKMASAPPQDSKTGTTPVHPHERDVRRDWLAFTEYVKDRKVWMSKDLQRADSARQVENELHLHFSDPANCALLRTKENRLLLTEFVLDFFQKELKVRFILPADDEKSGSDESDRPQKQRQLLANNPQVQMAVDIFNGQIGDIRIGPRSR